MPRAVGLKSPTTPCNLEAVSKDAQCLELRRLGVSYEDISERTGLAPSTVYLAVKRALKKLNDECLEMAEEVRTLELQRLDSMYLSLARRIQAGDLAAIQTALKIQERRARYLGLDLQEKPMEGAPEQVIFVLRALAEIVMRYVTDVDTRYAIGREFASVVDMGRVPILPNVGPDDQPQP